MKKSLSQKCLAHVYFSNGTDSRLMKEIHTARKLCPNMNISYICKKGTPYKTNSDFKTYDLSYECPFIFNNKFFNFIAWSLRALNCLRKIRPDIIHAHGLPSAMISGLFKSIHKCTLIYDARELETKKNNLGWFRKFLLKYVERFNIYMCNSIITVAPLIKDFYKKKYPKKNILLIPNACSKQEDIKPVFNLREKLKIPKEDLIFLYIGGLGKSRGIELYLNTFQQLSDKYHLVIMGDGVLKSEVQRYANSTNNIHYLAPVPWMAVVGVAKQSDSVLRMLEILNESYRLALPNTYFQAMAAQTPIIINKDCIEMLNFYKDEHMVIPVNYNQACLTEKIIKMSKNRKNKSYPIPSILTWEHYEALLVQTYSN